jgi:dihydroorotase-like cyclic amidohydrolase
LSRLDLLVSDGLVETPRGTFKASIGIEDGVIVEIGSSASMSPAERKIDAEGLLVFPGIIDEHVHFREPGFEHKEDFRTGSMAAAAGGVTTVLDMPNTEPPTADERGFRAKLEVASRKSIVDFGFYAGVVPGKVEALRRAGRARSGGREGLHVRDDRDQGAGRRAGPHQSDGARRLLRPEGRGPRGGGEVDRGPERADEGRRKE